MLKILIAEDDRELRRLFAHVLLKNGYTVKEVGNGKEALDAIDAEYFDLIISDIMMPVMDGYEFVRLLREAGNTTPVLMITAKDAFDDMRLGILSGADDYMIKPVNVNEMVLRVQALLRRAQMINERKQTIGNTILECDTFTVTGYRKCITFKHSASNSLFAIVYHLRTAKKSLHAQYHFVNIDRLYHVIICSRYEAPTHIIKSILGSNH